MCLARGRTPGRERLVRVHLPQAESFRRAERKTFFWHGRAQCARANSLPLMGSNSRVAYEGTH